jgi:hypothetical protein
LKLEPERFRKMTRQMGDVSANLHTDFQAVAGVLDACWVTAWTYRLGSLAPGVGFQFFLSTLSSFSTGGDEGHPTSYFPHDDGEEWEVVPGSTLHFPGQWDMLAPLLSPYDNLIFFWARRPTARNAEFFVPSTRYPSVPVFDDMLAASAALVIIRVHEGRRYQFSIRADVDPMVIGGLRAAHPGWSEPQVVDAAVAVGWGLGRPGLD